MRYIKLLEQLPCFFASYGSFVHRLIDRYYSGESGRQNLVLEYLQNFRTEVQGVPPSTQIFNNYFYQGLAYFRSLKPIDGTVLATEQEVHFSIDSFPFVGFVDLVYSDDNNSLCIMDHKSRALKQRSGRKESTKSDLELDRYLRQLYLYSIPVSEKYGEYPKKLVFNCYRTGELVTEKFSKGRLEEAKQWALDSIQSITNHKDWNPDMNYWKCKYLCGLSHECEYYQMTGGDFR